MLCSGHLTGSEEVHLCVHKSSLEYLVKRVLESLGRSIASMKWGVIGARCFNWPLGVDLGGEI